MTPPCTHPHPGQNVCLGLWIILNIGLNSSPDSSTICVCVSNQIWSSGRIINFYQLGISFPPTEQSGSVTVELRDLKTKLEWKGSNLFSLPFLLCSGHDEETGQCTQRRVCVRQLCCPNISATCTMVIMIYCHTEVLGKLKKILLLSQLLGGSWRWVHWWMLFDQQSAVAWNIVSSSIVCRRIALYCQCRIVTLLPVQNPRTANLISINI